jgi:DNA-binding beta-propeller fold protein YncE
MAASSRTGKWQGGERQAFLRAACGVAEGAVVVATDEEKPCCVAAALRDPQSRLCIMSARETMPRSLGSVFAGSIVRFLSRFEGTLRRVIATPGVRSWCNGVAVTRDSSTMLVSSHGDRLGTGLNAAHAFDVLTGAHLGVLNGLPLDNPRQVSVAPDGIICVADNGNNCVQVFQLPYVGLSRKVGVGQLAGPSGVCVDGDIIAVSERDAHRISIYERHQFLLIRRFGSIGGWNGLLNTPVALCMISGHIAVMEFRNHRISVFSTQGAFIRTLGVGIFNYPTGIACASHGNEVFVTDALERVVMFSASGEFLMTMGRAYFTGVALHGGAVFAQTYNGDGCMVFT